MKLLHGLKRYGLLYAAVTASGCVLLLLAGLLPQARIMDNAAASMDQLILEGPSYGALFDGHPRSTLDAPSEALILIHSAYMDTSRDPAAILSNPGWFEGNAATVQFYRDAKAALETRAPADRFYVRYWMGFRALLRPLLTLMALPDIRQLLMWALMLLTGAVALTLYRHTRSMPVALAFVFAVSQLNPIALFSSVQYGMAFLLAMAGMLLVPRAEHARLTDGMLFFILGAATQYFDFYTAPFVTFGFPALMLLAIRRDDPGLASLAARMKKIGLCLLAWLSAYVLMWLAKLVLTTALTPYDALESGLGALAGWMRHEGVQTAGEEHVALAALYNCMLCITDWLPMALEAALGVAWTVQCIRARRGGAAFSGALPLLAVALTPLVWILVAAKPAYTHFYYQYRVLGVFLFGLLLFLLRSAGWDRPNDGEALLAGGAGCKAEGERR